MPTTCPQCATPAATERARHCHECGARLPTGGGRTTDGSEVADATDGAPPPPRRPGGPRPRPAAHPSGLDSDVRNWAMAAHLSAFLGAWVALAFLGPLVVWLVKRDADPFVEEHAREALNFNLTLLIWLAGGVVLSFVLIGIPLLIMVGLAWLILTVVAAVRASNGGRYRYPLTIRFVS